MKAHCPLHPDATTTCPCCRSQVLERDLYVPVAMTLWQCWAGHQIVGAPFLSSNQLDCYDSECAHDLHPLAVGVWTPKRPEVPHNLTERSE